MVNYSFETIKEKTSSEDIKVEVIDDKVLVSIQTENKDSTQISKLIKDTLEVVEKAREDTGATETDVLIGGIDKNIQSMASSNDENKLLKEKIEELEKADESGN